MLRLPVRLIGLSVLLVPAVAVEQNAGTVAVVPAGGVDEAVLGTIDGPLPPVAPAVMRRDEQGRTTIRAIKLGQGMSVDGRLDERVYDDVRAFGGSPKPTPGTAPSATFPRTNRPMSPGHPAAQGGHRTQGGASASRSETRQRHPRDLGRTDELRERLGMGRAKRARLHGATSAATWSDAVRRRPSRRSRGGAFTRNGPSNAHWGEWTVMAVSH